MVLSLSYQTLKASKQEVTGIKGDIYWVLAVYQARSFHLLPDSPMTKLLFFPFDWWGNWGMGLLNHLRKVTQLGRARARIHPLGRAHTLISSLGCLLIEQKVESWGKIRQVRKTLPAGSSSRSGSQWGQMLLSHQERNLRKAHWICD